ncbi:Glutathione import ATP-binding protein GsiA [Serratia liquefaciens]|nr:Glutathione import ATP-binding protein GsiA [Serratia liquefaciens]
MTVLSVEDLRISYRSRGEWREVVHNISFSIQRGEMLAFVGESGSGKTTTAQAIIGLLADNARRDAGRIVLNGEVISDWSDKRLNRLRGVSISLVPQDPGNSLNPVKTIGQQVEEILRLHQSLSAAERRQQVLNLLAKVGLSHPEQRFDQYPHQLSGGMKQRVLIAIAIALQPDLIIADEPTSALDVTVQKRILDLLDILRRESGTAVLFVTHDLALAAERADRIMVFRQGEIQEQGATETIVQRPQHPYTRQLLHDLQDAPLRLTAARHRPLATPAIRVEGISKRFSLGKQALQALDSVSFEVRRGSTHALVGESGSGKTTLARILLGFERADAGQVIIDGIDAGHLSREAQRQLRRKIQFVYQNPFASLDPRQTLFAIIEEPLKNFERLSAATRRQRVESVAARVALAPELLSRTPRELSGGQRQRVAIARALILEPAILVLDEATSALDVTVQAQILALLQQLQQQLGLSYLFITHDLATVRRIADSVTVLCAGQVVEHGDRKPPVRRPAAGLHPRTDRRHSPGFPPLSTGPHGERIMPKRLGFFTRLLDQGSAQTRYRLAAEQIRHAERLGFDSAWIAQHHFHEQEGGLPSPLVFLAHVAAQTDRIRLGTAIITLPMENPLRVAEDAAVLDLLTDGRLEVGFGSGGTPTSFLPFGLTSEQRGAAFCRPSAPDP